MAGNHPNTPCQKYPYSNNELLTTDGLMYAFKNPDLIRLTPPL